MDDIEIDDLQLDIVSLWGSWTTTHFGKSDGGSVLTGDAGSKFALPRDGERVPEHDMCYEEALAVDLEAAKSEHLLKLLTTGAAKFEFIVKLYAVEMDYKVRINRSRACIITRHNLWSLACGGAVVAGGGPALH
jgi:hypothetical protein